MAPLAHKTTLQNDGCLNFVDENDEVLISGFGRSGKAKGDIPGVRFKVVKVSGVGLLALWKEKKVICLATGFCSITYASCFTGKAKVVNYIYRFAWPKVPSPAVLFVCTLITLNAVIMLKTTWNVRYRRSSDARNIENGGFKAAVIYIRSCAQSAI